MREAGLAAELVGDADVRDAFKAMPVKFGPQTMRATSPNWCGLAGSVRCIASRWRRKGGAGDPDGAQCWCSRSFRDVESSLRGILRGFGLKGGKTTPSGSRHGSRSWSWDIPNLQIVTEALLAVRSWCCCAEFNGFEKARCARWHAATFVPGC